MMYPINSQYRYRDLHIFQYFSISHTTNSSPMRNEVSHSIHSLFAYCKYTQKDLSQISK